MPGYRNIPIYTPCYSEVAANGDRAFCVTIDEMVECGVSDKLIWRTISGQREGELHAWSYHKEGKTVYLHYSGLKPNYQAMIRTTLLDGQTPEKWYEKNGRIRDIRDKLEPYFSLSAQEEIFFDKAKFPNGQYLNPRQQEDARRACMILSFLSKVKKADAKELGYNSTAGLYDDITFLIAGTGVHLPKVYTKLRQKIREYEEKGAACCIDERKQSNKNAAKVYTEDQIAVLQTICSRGASYNAKQTADMYNVLAESRGWERISRRSVLNYMKEYNLLIEAGRNGSEAFRNKLSMQPRRKKPSEAMSFWSIDGWTVELYYQKEVKNKEGKTVRTYTNRLTAVVVLDAYNSYPVGYAIGEHESVGLIKMAIKNAMDHCKLVYGNSFRPYQIQSDRYGIKSMKTVYDDVVKYFTPARVKNAKSKPIERYFLTLNRDYCQLYFGNYNWSGFGVKSKQKSQPNIDVLNHNKTQFPDKEGVIKQINWIITEERKKKIAIWTEGFQKMPVEDRLLMDRETYLLHFGHRNDRTKRLEAGCFEPTILGEKRPYDTFDLNFRKNSLESWTVIYDEQDLNTVLVVDKTEKERYLLTAVHQQPMALRDRQDGDFEALRAIDQYNKQVLESHVTNKISAANEITMDLITNTPAVQDKLVATMLTDSRGQHKNWLQPSALIKSEEDLAAEEESMAIRKVAKIVAKQQKKSEKTEAKRKEAAHEARIREVVDLDKFK